MHLTQRQVAYGAFGIMLAVSISYGINDLLMGDGAIATVAFGSALVYSGLLAAYWRGWAPARLVLVIASSSFIGFAMKEPFLTQQTVLWLMVPIILTQVLASPRWVVGVALGSLSLMLIRAGFRGAYIDPIYLSAYGTSVLGLVLTQLVLTSERRTAEANAQRAEHERARTAAALDQVEQQATDLRAYTAEQQRLLSLVTMLETPVIMLAPGILLAPVVGTLDQQRAQVLTRRLLEMVSAQRAQVVILDLAGVPGVDAAVAHAVLHTAESLRLLGCRVTITGISSAVAMTLTQLDVNLNALSIARSPHEVLAATHQQT